jgi:hypothetical protein
MVHSTGQLARRWLLQRVLGAIGALVLFYGPPRPAIAVIKISQKAVAYQDHPEGDKRCDKCIQFQPPNACKMVDGSISPNGYCQLFVPNRQSAGRSRTIGAMV